ncbi:hypothetical protein Hanom_Chr14g01290941 [Helianthus anomalus]
MGFSGHLNGKMLKLMFCDPYKFMIHCVVHALSHRKGACDESSDYIMNIITCLVLNRPYNVSKVIFEYLAENTRFGSTKYIMYPRFIMMMIDNQFKDIQKDANDVLGLRNMTPETISRLTKGPEPRVKRMICRINNPTYIAPENDMWRHENSKSENEDEKINQMDEKKTRWWFDLQKSLNKDWWMIHPTELLKQGVHILNMSYADYLKKNDEATAKDQSSSIPTESVTEKEADGVVHDDSSEADSESTETETELDLTTLGQGKAQLKKKPTKKKKTSDEEDNTYSPSAEKTKKLRAKRKVVQSGVILRNVRARKGSASVPKDQGGKKEKHVTTSTVQEAEKVQSVEVPKEPEVQSVPEVEFQKKGGDVDYVELTWFRAATPLPPPPPQDQPIPERGDSSQPKNKDFYNLFGDLPNATGVYKDDLGLDDYFDVFNNAAIKALEKKVGELEKEKAKAEAELDLLKKQVKELSKTNEEIKTVMINQAKKLKKLKDSAHNNSQLFEIL